MASPVIEQTTTGGESGGVTSHTVTLPSTVDANDLLIVMFKTFFLNSSNSWPKGWYVFAHNRGFYVAYKLADGTEGGTSFEVLTVRSSRSAFICYRLSGAEDPFIQAPEAGFPMPINYRGLVTGETYRMGTGVASRELEASSENPGAFKYQGSAIWAAATSVIHPSGSAFPVIEDTAVSLSASGVTSHTVNLPPSIVSGETVFGIFQKFGSEDDVTWPAGWTELTFFGASGRGISIGWRKADGGEGSSITVDTGISRRSATAVYRISGATDPTVTPPEISSGASGTSATPSSDSLTPTGGSKKYLWFTSCVHDANSDAPIDGPSGNSTAPDPPSITPTGGSKDYLFIACSGYNNNDDMDIATLPTGYSTGLTASNFLAAVGSCHKAATASSEDPGALAWNGAADNWGALTIAIHPAVSVTAVVTGTSVPSVTDKQVRGVAA